MSVIIDPVSNAPLPAKRQRLAIDSPYINRAQKRHFVLFNVLPALGAVGAGWWALEHGVSALDWGLFGAMWLATGLGVSAGYHRLFTHRSFKTTKPVRAALAVAGSMAALGPVISWTAMHRRHHDCADGEGDVHSPNLHGDGFLQRVRGFIHAHITWMYKHDYPNIAHYAPDLLSERTMVKISRHYQLWVLLGLALPALVGGVATGTWQGALGGFLWGGVLRMFVVTQSISALNSVSHSVGSRPYQVQDKSHNSELLGVLIWGEGWHHNHHAFPTSASFGLAWYRVDLAYWLILLLKGLGLAWDIKLPTKRQLAARRAHADGSAVPGSVSQSTST